MLHSRNKTTSFSPTTNNGRVTEVVHYVQKYKNFKSLFEPACSTDASGNGIESGKIILEVFFFFFGFEDEALSSPTSSSYLAGALKYKIVPKKIITKSLL